MRKEFMVPWDVTLTVEGCQRALCWLEIAGRASGRSHPVWQEVARVRRELALRRLQEVWIDSGEGK